MMKRTFWPSMVCLAMVVALGGMVFSFDFSTVEKTVTEHTLKNGLKILVMERHDAPVVSFATWVNAGSADDPKGYTGLAHMFEHMAFKGTTTLGTKDYKAEAKAIALEDSLFMLLRAERNKGRLTDTVLVAKLQKDYEAAREASYAYVNSNEFGNIVEREGGVGMNAGTAYDWTMYTYSLPSNKLEMWMMLESERFLNPVFREMYKERDVVAEERRMRIESNPIGRLLEEYGSLAFKAHPYGVSGVGHMSDIQYYSREEAKAFFSKYYVPSNMTVVIVGDVDPKNAIALAEKYWNRIPYKPKPQLIATIEPPQIGEKRVVLEDPSQPIFIAGWKIPERTHPDRPAIEAFLEYLTSGRTSVMYEAMVKESKIAVQVQAFPGYPGDKYPTMGSVLAVPSAGHTAAECEAAVFGIIDSVKALKISAEELDKIKVRNKASFVGQLEDNDGMAFQLGAYQLYWGDWREMFRELDRINAVTPEDVQRVAQQYFIKSNRTVAIMNTVES
ncbi:MAG: insulinase family protein [bacterium]|nr:insulinase family protein [bacterium]